MTITVNASRRGLRWLPLLLLSSSLALAQSPQGVPAPPAAPANQELAEVEKSLADARKRLDEAALELARLHEKVEVTRTVKGGGRAMLGVLIDDPKRRDGVFISGVTPGGGAAAAGMRSGDVITKINGEALDGKQGHPHKHISIIMERVRAGDPVQVAFLRNGSEQEVEVVTKASGHYVAAIARGKFDRHHDEHSAKHIEIDMECFEPEDLLEELADNFGINLLNSSSGSGSSVIQLQSSTPHLVNLTPDLAQYFDTESGVLVVNPPARANGLKAGDVIEQISGKPVNSVQDALQMLRTHGGKDGTDELRLDVLRRGETKRLKIEANLLGATDSRVIRIAGPQADIKIELSRTPTGRTNLAP